MIRLQAFILAGILAMTEPCHAVEVAHNGDTGPGSLRQSIEDAAPGSTITFAPPLDRATIILASGQITIDKALTIDASSLSSPITIDGNEGELPPVYGPLQVRRS